MFKIERVGKTTGRWQEYQLIVNGVNLGRVKRTLMGGGDRMQPHSRHEVWRIHGVLAESRESAEAQLIERAIRFGQLPAETA